MNQLTAVILAAGEAKRMRSARPKVLHPLCGRPLIAYPVHAAHAIGARIVVVLGRAADDVRAAVSAQLSTEAAAGFVEQKERLGTGHAVLQAHVAAGDGAGARAEQGVLEDLDPNLATQLRLRLAGARP